MLLMYLREWLVPTAHAVTLEKYGSWNNPVIQAMWQRICTVLPFCGVGLDGPRMFACKIARFIFGSISGVAVCVIIYAALKMVIAQGEDGEIAEAKKMIFYAAGGLVLSMISFAVVPFISIVASSAFGNSTTSAVILQCQ